MDAPPFERDLARARIHHQWYTERILRPGRRPELESQLLVLTHDYLVDAERALPEDDEHRATRIAVLRQLASIQDALGDHARSAASRGRAAALEQGAPGQGHDPSE